MPRADVTFRTSDHDDAMMRILVNLEALQALALEAGDTALAAQLKATFDENLQRYYDTKRAQLEATLEGAAARKASRRA